MPCWDAASENHVTAACMLCVSISIFLYSDTIYAFLYQILHAADVAQ